LEQLVVRASENYAAGETVNGDIPLFESIIPGSPIIEMVAKEQSKKWESLTDAFKNDGLQTSFSGIIINGRVGDIFDNKSILF
jgi:tRNA A37 threonylcarbamoyltransferase TsaD